MLTIADAQIASLTALGFPSGTINDRLREYFTQSGYEGHIDDQWQQYFDSKEIPPGPWSQRMFAWLGEQGYVGSVRDRMLQGWLANDVLTPVVIDSVFCVNIVRGVYDLSGERSDDIALNVDIVTQEYSQDGAGGPPPDADLRLNFLTRRFRVTE